MSTQDIPNTIERHIEIAAPIHRVWALGSEPDWWINEGEIRQHQLEIELAAARGHLEQV